MTRPDQPQLSKLAASRRATADSLRTFRAVVKGVDAGTDPITPPLTRSCSLVVSCLAGIRLPRIPSRRLGPLHDCITASCDSDSDSATQHERIESVMTIDDRRRGWLFRSDREEIRQRERPDVKSEIAYRVRRREDGVGHLGRLVERSSLERYCMH